MPQHGEPLSCLLCALISTRSSDVRTALQTVDGGLAQVVVAMPDLRRRSPRVADIQKGVVTVELVQKSLVSLVWRCKEEGYGLIGGECLPCPPGAFCPGVLASLAEPKA
jgi:hypothetical protein